VSNIINGNRGVGEDTLLAIAHAFKIPPEQVFRAAKLLPENIKQSPTLEEVNYKMDQLTEDQQQMVLDLIDTLIDRKDRGNAKNKRGPMESPNTTGA
jgi:transcriptional regulator with XRE-family HTH domain